MKKFINFILVIFFIFLILLAYDNKDKIYIFYRDNILKVKDNIIIERNAYFKDNDYLYVQNTNNVINTRYDKCGKITLSIKKTYNEEQIKLIEDKVNEIINNNINSSMNDIEKIKVIHDYIINNANYDTSLEKLKYSKADDVLLYKRGICSSYTDAMSIFLNRFNINNYKIASEEHIWNLVYLNNNWLHLDLTWDDPVNENGKDILDYNYYLITTKKLKEIDNSKSHRFNKDFYLELKES